MISRGIREQHEKAFKDVAMLNNKAFSIVEMLIAMAIFIGLILVMSSAFDTILSKGTQQMRSAETSTEGIVGLEMLRGDLEHTGYGLPWSYPVAPNPAITETTAGTGVAGITAADYNETIAPRALRVGTSTTTGTILSGNSTNPGVAYLVMKSTRVALNDTVRKWAYANYSTQAGVNKSYVKKWGTSDDLSAGDLVITLNTTFPKSGPDRQLIMDSAAASPNYYYAMPGTTPAYPADVYKPQQTDHYVVYGVDSGASLRMPYNRADYYVKRPSAGMPDSCNAGTGILYKGVVQQATGTFVEYPLLNCVGDMQVQLELDATGTGNISYLSTPGTSPDLTNLTAAGIRSDLKNIRVYILAHEGKKDRSYSYEGNSIQVGDISMLSSGKIWDSDAMQTTFGTDWRNYRWKVYTIVVRPKNLN